MLTPRYRDTAAQVQWKTPTLAILHVGFFGVDSARRAGVMIDLRQKIWSAGGLVATAPKAKVGKRGGEAAVARGKGLQRPSVEDVAEERAGGREEGGAGTDGPGDDDEPYAIPFMRAASEGHTALAHGGGGTSGGGGGDGSRSGVPPPLRSVSAALTLKEGLVHKVNAGLSGLETNIFFQLMLPKTAKEAAPPVEWAGAYCPIFSGGDLEELASGHAERFAGASRVKYVGSYLRRRRWYWSFGGSGSATFPPPPCDSGGAAAATAAAAGGGEGGGGGVDSLAWSTYVQKMIHSLTRSRRADGFVLVERRENEALMVKGVRITLGVVPAEDCWKGVGAGTGSSRGGEQAGGKSGARGGVGGEGSAGGGGGDGSGGSQRGSGTEAELRTMRMVLQYRVFEVGLPSR